MTYNLHSYFKLNCTETLKEMCIDYLNSNWDFRTQQIFRIEETEIAQVLNNELESIGLVGTVSVCIFARGPGNWQPIHLDTNGPDGTEVWNSAIYIPFLGSGPVYWFDPNEVTMKWVDLGIANKFNKNVVKVYRGEYYDKNNRMILDLDRLPVIGVKSDTEPAIIATHIPHRAQASNQPRAALTIGLKENPTLEYLQNFVKNLEQTKYNET